MSTGLIKGDWITGSGRLRRSVEAMTGMAIDPGHPAVMDTDVDRAAAAADVAFDTFRELKPDARAAFLETIADELVLLGDPLIDIDSRTTSVSSLAIDRCLRPVCCQSLPDALLPAALRDGNLTPCSN